MAKSKAPKENLVTQKTPPARTEEVNNTSQCQGESQSNRRLSEQTKTSEKIDRGELIKAVIDSLQPDAKQEKGSYRDQLIQKYLCQELSLLEVFNKYNILFLYDEGRMVRRDADDIYSTAAAFKEKKPILLVLYSAGGVIGSAYLIGQLCREYTNDKFVVVVPRQAKSAATLLCCAADEIHMGSLSELGPIDPQIDDLPALGLKSSVTHICDLIKDNPHASEMFAKYLHLSLNPIQLGYYERVAESASQYAERLLKPHKDTLKREPKDIAKILVYSYKDHGFVIDKTEAVDIFGDKTINVNTPEYELGNIVYEHLNLIYRIAKIFDHTFYIIGSQPHFVKSNN